MVAYVSDHESDRDSDYHDDLSSNGAGATLRKKAGEAKVAHPVLVLVLRLFGEHSQERAWRRGAEGEEEVGRQLRKLGNGWRIIHSVPIGTGEVDIDHLVIGPPGVFTLNAKNHLGGRVSVTPKAIYVNGKFQPYLAKSRAEGNRATKILTAACGYEINVQPLIVILANDLRLKGSTEGVHVVGRKRVTRWLRKRIQVLSTDEVEAIYAVARRRRTWVG